MKKWYPEKRKTGKRRFKDIDKGYRKDAKKELCLIMGCVSRRFVDKGENFLAALFDEIENFMVQSVGEEGDILREALIDLQTKREKLIILDGEFRVVNCGHRG